VAGCLRVKWGTEESCGKNGRGGERVGGGKEGGGGEEKMRRIRNRWRGGERDS